MCERRYLLTMIFESISDDSKLIFSFEYPIVNYSSSVTQEDWYTTPLCVVNDLPLRLWIKKVDSNDKKGIMKDSLAFYLQLEVSFTIFVTYMIFNSN